MPVADLLAVGLALGAALLLLGVARYLYARATRTAKVEEQRLRELERLALRDPLTGAHNRRYFDEALRREIHRYHRYERPVSLVLFDVDDLKTINDRGGHAAGDSVLRSIAATAEESVRASDSVVRLGGDEFAVLLPETDRPNAAVVAKRLLGAVERLPVPAGAHATISAGVASIPRDGGTAEEVHARADEALYRAKRHGRNRFASAGARGGEPDSGTYAKAS
jgi:diguanylate cyclase (GGDEF)-like protein